ncbi:MAG: CCA tRNA nucleotidyltransferase, partial [Methylocystis sp.]
MNNTDILLNDLKLKRLFSCLSNTGEESRIVGGAIRDVLCGKTPQEIDLATIALPESVMRAAEQSGYKVVPTGIEHGTVTIIIDGQPFEVTTLRTDVETDGRYAKVTFGNSFEEDAKRRDFTINALSLSQNGVIYDYVNGLVDLKSGRVRFIGDPETIINEYFLRILRFFRFSASHGVGDLDPEGLKQCILAKD